LATIAVETAPEFEARLRAAPWRPPAVPAGTTPIEDREPAANGHIEPWELHSELAFVCPEVRERARELLPERDPDAFLPKRREPVLLPALAVDEVGPSTRLPVAVSAYVLWRLIETARSCLIAVGGVIALAMLAEALH
jgi:hypothetical protein